jgi:ribosomal-protein-alanine N-acetyltransferase
MFVEVKIKTKRLLIRTLSMSDLESVYSIVSDDDVLRFLPDDKMSRAQFSGVLEWLIRCYAHNTEAKIIKFTLAIALKDAGTLVGWCGLGPLEFEQEKIELYYGLAKDFWGQGIATEAGRAMVDYGFNVIGLKEIVAVVSPENMASKRVIEKMGMSFVKQVAGLPDQFINYENDLYYSLTRDNYLEKSHDELNKLK